MAKTNAAFKLGKMVKLTMGTITDREQRRIYKDAMVDAQASYMASKNRKFVDPASAQKGGNRTNGGQTPPASA